MTSFRLPSAALALVVLVLSLAPAAAHAARPATRSQGRAIAAAVLPPSNPYYSCGRVAIRRKPSRVQLTPLCDANCGFVPPASLRRSA